MVTEAIRNYEVSIWTLQDEFITVLKWPNLEQKGEIENPKLTLDVDGTRNFTFSIPMYLYQNNKLVENPIWYNTRNGNIAVDMRKIKVIFNKNEFNPAIIDWKKEFYKVYMPYNYNGNVNLFNRPVVPVSNITAVGYTDVVGDYATVYSAYKVYTDVNEIEYKVIYTPIQEDGSVKNDTYMTTYLNSIISSSTSMEQWLANDRNQNKQILSIFPIGYDISNWQQELYSKQKEWDQIRASCEMLSNTNNITFATPTYKYYKKYLRSINTFEFLITKINETHERDILTCEVTCDGLAFQELGKRGYIYDLSVADYELTYKEWQEAGGVEISRPRENVQFWCDKIGLKPTPMSEKDIDPLQWYYEIQMNYDSFSDNLNRSSNCVYEEPFATDWTINSNTGKLEAGSFENYREKERAIEAKESNIYNITQTIAEKFEIYCRYVYEYDINYNIIARKIIFFNNYLHDDDIISLTYPYSSSRISREMDSTDITTKLFVRSAEDYSTLLGDMNIRYCAANRTQEDYILNFNYLKETGNITEEQIKAIEDFEIEMHRINSELYPLENKISFYTTEKTELEAKIAFYEKSVALDKENIEYNQDYVTRLTSADGTEDEYIDSHNEYNPEFTIITHDENNNYCINLDNRKKGIRCDSVKIYRYYNSGNHSFPEYIPNSDPQVANELSGFNFKCDDYGNPSRIYGVEPYNNSSSVYLTYSYEPKVYYEAVAQTWIEKCANDQEQLEILQDRLNDDTKGIIHLLEEAQNDYDDLLSLKQHTIKDFENLMGPALREGYWQPEDYADYGELYENTKRLPTTFDISFKLLDSGNSFAVGWDNKLFEEEQDAFYYRSINSVKVAYPMIKLSGLSSSVLADIENYSFIFNNNYYMTITSEQMNEVRYTRSFSVGSEALVGFIRDTTDDKIIPVLILVGAKNMPDDQIAFMCNSAEGHPRLGKIITDTDNSTEFNKKLKIDTNSVINITDQWIDTSVEDQYETVFPRIKFSSLMLKTSSSDLYIRYNGTLLEEYENYYIRNRHIEAGTYAPEYLITIKPIYICKTAVFNGKIRINYILSNASTSIYVDALKVSDENAVPKVSYIVDPNILNKDVLRMLHTKLNWLVMINDVQLKFENVFGYISKLDLDLDFPTNDSIEIKNYKTKFEDLFSTIVASSEAMKQSEGLLSSLAGGTYSLPPESTAASLESAQPVVYQFLDEYITTSEGVQDFLSSLFYEAGTILSDANQTLNQNQALTLQNSSILSDFAIKVQNNLVPSVFRQAEAPQIFKKGDIWIQINNQNTEEARYIAVADSSNTIDGCSWMETYNGGLGQIRGAGMDINVAEGKISITAENELYIGSGNLLRLSGEDVSIVGNRSVNIGGTTINIGSTSALANDCGGINIIAIGYDTEALVSKVLIHPETISMFGSTIEMAVGKTVNNTLTSVSAIKLDPEDGIWLGSSNKISMFADGNVGTVANVEISPAHIFFGMHNVNKNDATAVELTTDYIILTAGVVGSSSAVSNVSSIASNGITINGSLAGVEIKKDKIGLAVGSNNTRSVIIMDNNGIKVGAGTNPEGSAGTFVTIAGSGIVIGSGGSININTNGKFIMNTTNFKVNPDAQSTNAIFYVGSGGTTSTDKYIKYSLTNGLEIQGAITATSLAVGSGSIMTYDSTNGLVIGTGTNKLQYNNSVLSISGGITATTLSVGSNNNLLTYDSTNGLIVKGNVTATGGSIGAWKVGDNLKTHESGTVQHVSTLLTGGNRITRVTFVGPGTSSYNVTGGNQYINLNKWYLYAGADWPEDAPGYSLFQTPGPVNGVDSKKGIGWAPFRVMRNGETYIKTLCIGNGPSSLYSDEYSTEDWSGYVGEFYFWIQGTANGQTVYKWVKIDGQRLYNAVLRAETASGCFVAGTLVNLPDGTKIPIESITVGTEILAYDETTGTFVPGEVGVMQRFKHRNCIYDLYLSSGKIITVTHSHPFLTTDGWKALNIEAAKYDHHMNVGLLQEHDELINNQNEHIYIEQIKYRDDLQDETVYHCSIDQYHTFLVEDIVVHNVVVDPNEDLDMPTIGSILGGTVPQGGGGIGSGSTSSFTPTATTKG